MGWPWQTMVFTTLALLQLGHALTVRSERESFFTLGVWSNPLLLAAGGLLLLVVALDLLRGEVEGLSGESQVNIAFVPLGRPLLAGPGAIAAIMVFLREASTAPERVGVALGLASVLVVLWLALRFAGVVRRVLEQPGIEW
jgi:multiple antibiotic resistance protein